MPEPVTVHHRLLGFEPYPEEGRVTRIDAGQIETDGPDLSVGMHCEVMPAIVNAAPVRALVAAVANDNVVLVPFGPVSGLKVGDRVRALPDGTGFPAGDAFAGRAIDALGRPIDGSPAITARCDNAESVSVLDRTSPHAALTTGIRAIDGLLTIGRGQRIGIFAASGVGKTRLLCQILEQAACDRLVVCLVGQRGREAQHVDCH